MRNHLDQQKTLQNPFAYQKQFAEPLKSSKQPLIYWHTLGTGIVTQFPSEHIEKEWINAETLIFSNLAEPLDEPCRTLGLRGMG
jgi:hypothetical protein